MRLGLGEPVRTIRDTADHRLTSLGTLPTRPSVGFPLPLGFLVTTDSFTNLRRGLPDPGHTVTAPGQRPRQPITVRHAAAVLDLVDGLHLIEHRSHLIG